MSVPIGKEKEMRDLALSVGIHQVKPSERIGRRQLPISQEESPHQVLICQHLDLRLPSLQNCEEVNVFFQLLHL